MAICDAPIQSAATYGFGSSVEHIASIDEGLYDNFIVCRSTAGGPQASRGNSFVYQPGQKLFSIEPSPVKSVGKVHIVSVGLS
jgi:hypothetical protein